MMRIDILKDRSHMLSQARSFFAERDVIEVDCPLLTRGASVDLHIDLMPTLFRGSEKRYLHSSPEYGMKRLLSEGMPDCYQLAHVFRDGEVSNKHNPEFMMAEWYRLGFSFEELIEETLDFIRLFLGPYPSTTMTYRHAFEKYVGINPFTATIDDLLAVAEKKGVSVYKQAVFEGKDALLNLLLATLVEPKLGREELTVLAFYPASQAALAIAKEVEGDPCACRFEVYFKGVELCNGYEELADPLEQRRRFEEANVQRIAHGKEPLPLDESFLKALKHGLPACCGVAVGFDRLMMLRHNATALSEVIPFDWETA